MKVRGKAGVEELKGGREQIVITEIPYNVNRATLVERIAELVNEKVLTDITAIRDESDENTRVVIELKRDAQSKGRHQQSLQAHRAGKLLRRQHARDRSRPAETAFPQGCQRRLHRASPRSRPAPNPLRIAQSRGTRRDARRLPHRARESR